MNMNHNAKDQILSLLQNYRATKRKIEQLCYELEHPARVTPDEMIEAMNFAKGDGEGRPSGSVSNKTLYIAMNFQSAADEANAAMTHDLVSRLVPLEQEINRLEHYVALLEPRQTEVIRLAYFEGLTWQQISAKTQITTRTLYKIPQSGGRRTGGNVCADCRSAAVNPWCSHLFLKGFTYCSPSLTLKGHLEAGIL